MTLNDPSPCLQAAPADAEWSRDELFSLKPAPIAHVWAKKRCSCCLKTLNLGQIYFAAVVNGILIMTKLHHHPQNWSWEVKGEDEPERTICRDKA